VQLLFGAANAYRHFHQRQRKSRRDHAVGEAILFPSCSFSTIGVLARVGAIAVGVIALAAACASEPPTAPGADQEPAAALVSAPPAPAAAYANTKLSELIESAPNSVVAGERLNVQLLRRFYARHGFAPVWTTRQSQADSLMKAVLRAGDHGLSPELFHADLLQSPDALPTLERDLLLSNAFLTYADALARGFMPIERLRYDDVLTP